LSGLLSFPTEDVGYDKRSAGVPSRGSDGTPALRLSYPTNREASLERWRRELSVDTLLRPVASQQDQMMGLLSRFFGPPSQDQFAKAIMRAFRDAGDTREFEYQADQFRLVVAGQGDESGSDDAPSAEVLNLHKFYAEYCNLSRALRKEHLKQVVRGVSQGKIEMPDEFAHAAPDLRPRIWPRSMFAKLELQERIKGGNEVDVPRYLIGNNLSLGLVYDLPHSMRSISGDDLKGWDVSWYEAMEAAKEALSEVEFAVAKIGDHLYASASGDNYDASRLILIDLIRQMEVDGDHVAMIPNRDTLLVTGSNDDEGLAIMADLAEKALDDPRPLGATPVRLHDDEWVDWMPPLGHPLRDKFREMERQFFYLEYADQKESMEQLYAKDEIDIFVATCTAVRNQETEEIFTYCVWPEGVEAMLPVCGKVILGTGGQSGQMADWDKVQAVAGELMRADETLYPPRFHVSEFPTPAQLEAIGGEPLGADED
jgi:hypothetical protein